MTFEGRMRHVAFLGLAQILVPYRHRLEARSRPNVGRQLSRKKAGLPSLNLDGRRMVRRPNLAPYKPSS
jgi:hypothetical protein